jgi:hypothetical protein
VAGDPWRGAPALADAPERELELGDIQLEHAVLVLGLDARLVHHGGQGEGAAESPVGALHAMVVVLLDLVVELAFAAQGQGVVLQPDVDGLGIHPGQLGLHHDVAVLLVDVHGGGPGAAQRPFVGAATAAGAVRIVEQAVHPLLQAHQVTKRFPANNSHVSSS